MIDWDDFIDDRRDAHGWEDLVHRDRGQLSWAEQLGYAYDDQPVGRVSPPMIAIAKPALRVGTFRPLYRWDIVWSWLLDMRIFARWVIL